jgi:hypothetical protein
MLTEVELEAEKLRDKSIAGLLRKLRPILPGKVKKLGKCVYTIDGLVLVQLNYYCYSTFERLRNAKDTNKKVCTPNSVTVKLDAKGICESIHGKNSFRYVQSISSILRTRTFGKRKDDTFPLESIATYCTKGIEAVKDYKKDLAKKKKEKAARNKRVNAALRAVKKHYSKKTVDNRRDSLLINNGAGVNVGISITDDGGGTFYDLEIEKISSLPQLLSILKTVGV